MYEYVQTGCEFMYNGIPLECTKTLYVDGQPYEPQNEEDDEKVDLITHWSNYIPSRSESTRATQTVLRSNLHFTGLYKRESGKNIPCRIFLISFLQIAGLDKTTFITTVATSSMAALLFLLIIVIVALKLGKPKGLWVVFLKCFLYLCCKYL